MTREERENAIRCLKLWIEKEPYIQTYKTCLEALEQSMPTMVYPQVDGITPTVVAQTDGEYISRKALLEDLYKRDYTKFTHRDFVALVQYQDIVAIPNKTKTGHCEDCKQFRKLPYHADTLGKCIHHGGFCPKGDWYCADFEPQESEVRNG